MRIAFYAPMKPPDHAVPSGDRRMARLLMTALSGAGHEVRLASRLRSWDDGTSPGRQAKLRRLGARIAGRLAARWRDDPAAPRLWFTYHLYHKAPDWLGPPIADALRIPYVAAEASFSARRRAGPWAEGAAAAEAAIRRADALITFSDVDEAGLRPLAAPARILRLRPFLDAAPFAAARAERARWRGYWFGEAPGPWLLAIGMMRPGDKQRSYAVLAEALAAVAGPWRLAIVGDGPERARILAAFPADRLLWLGQRSEAELPGLYAAADLLAWPAVNEAFGMALLEAQAAGLPVVAGRTGGVPGIVRDGTTGLLTPPGDAAAFAAAVARLLADPVERQALGAAAARLALAEHGLSGASAILDRLVRRLAP